MSDVIRDCGVGADVLVICVFFVLGGLLEKVVGIPGPIMLILAAVPFKYVRVLPKKLEKAQTLSTSWCPPPSSDR
ncbi:MAG: 2-hydroxycarboxylate transporter family protein [Pseudomonas sp.]|uniref:2-hydroxycarboxylate transporter family protein n=1 Tax=Pseudomonas TaxID=286 RepID=UPI001D125989|nr:MULTISPECIES: 2-hydroxycarboxylate transporter family protein [Pseudomonas]